MSTDRTDPHKFLLHLYAVIGQAQNTDGLVSIPNILVPRAWLPHRSTKSVEPHIEDIMLAWFHSIGLHGGRTKRSVNNPGYPGLFQEVIVPPPWIQITIDDTEGNVSPERACEVEPLYIQATQHNGLEDRYKLYLEESSRQLANWIFSRTALPQREEVSRLIEIDHQMRLEHFRELLFLCHMLGNERIAHLASAVLDDEHLLPANGAPDLFLWSHDSTQSFWMFAEVKGPQDHLRPSQYHWIVRNWTHVRGHVVVVTII